MILNYLSRTEEIVKELLIPILIADLTAARNKGR